MTQDEFLENLSNAPCHEDDVMYEAQRITNNDTLQQLACKLELIRAEFDAELEKIRFEWG